MSDIETRLRQDLADRVGHGPSPDLFDGVTRSIADDRTRRRQLRHRLMLMCGVASAACTALVVLIPRDTKGPVMPWWTLEVLTTLVLGGLALWLGPFIKRFGRAYAADVFHDNPHTGKSYIVLTDVVYYLIFVAYILFTMRFAPSSDWANEVTERVTAEQLTSEVSRVGGILLIIGILHGLNIALMPVLGRLFSLNRRLPRSTDPWQD
jgi:hypothetical protein